MPTTEDFLTIVNENTALKAEVERLEAKNNQLHLKVISNGERKVLLSIITKREAERDEHADMLDRISEMVGVSIGCDPDHILLEDAVREMAASHTKEQSDE